MRAPTGLCVRGALPSVAERTRGLAEALAVVKKPNPVRQIEVELRRRDLKLAGIICSAALHGDEWRCWAWAAPRPTNAPAPIASRIDAGHSYFAAGHRLGSPAKRRIICSSCGEIFSCRRPLYL